MRNIMNTIYNKLFKKLKCNRGISILEILIAGLITGILATATFSFYVSMQQQTESQYELSELQNTCRTSLWDMKKNLRLAGFKIAGHPAFEISGDTLAVYYSNTQPVDSIIYYLSEYADWEYLMVPNLPDGKKLYNLMKKVNSEIPAIYSEFVTGIVFNEIDSANVIITITAQVSKQDETYQPNGGFREFSLAERIHIRNI